MCKTAGRKPFCDKREIFVMQGIRHLIDISDLTTEEIDGILAVAEDIMRDRAKYAHACEGKKIATLFFEPSTRTRLSFEAAMM